jgi:hypothetical protein
LFGSLLFLDYAVDERSKSNINFARELVRLDEPEGVELLVDEVVGKNDGVLLPIELGLSDALGALLRWLVGHSEWFVMCVEVGIDLGLSE